MNQHDDNSYSLVDGVDASSSFNVMEETTSRRRHRRTRDNEASTTNIAATTVIDTSNGKNYMFKCLLVANLGLVFVLLLFFLSSTIFIIRLPSGNAYGASARLFDVKVKHPSQQDGGCSASSRDSHEMPSVVSQVLANGIVQCCRKHTASEANGEEKVEQECFSAYPNVTKIFNIFI
jgi:hypothetical protein